MDPQDWLCILVLGAIKSAHALAFQSTSIDIQHLVWCFDNVRKNWVLLWAAAELTGYILDPRDWWCHLPACVNKLWAPHSQWPVLTTATLSPSAPTSSGIYAGVSAHPCFASLNICKRRGTMCAASCRLTSREWVVLLLACREFAVEARTDKLRWFNKLPCLSFGLEKGGTVGATWLSAIGRRSDTGTRNAGQDR